MRTDLEELKEEIGAAVTATAARQPSERGRRYSIKVIVPAAALAVVLVAFAIHGFGLAGTRAAAFEADRLSRLTTGGNALLAAISGDGRYVVHVKMDQLQPSLWVRQTATVSDVQIVPASRDGAQIALVRGQNTSDVLTISAK